MANMPLAVKREKRFTRALLVDATGDEVGATLCCVTVLPETGVQAFNEFVILCKQDSDGDVKLLIEQDPTTDFHLAVNLGRPFAAGSTVTVRP